MTSSYEKMSKAIRRQTDMEQKVRLMNAYEIAEEMIKFEDINSELYEALDACKSCIGSMLELAGGEPMSYEIALANKALAKARGEDQ